MGNNVTGRTGGFRLLLSWRDVCRLAAARVAAPDDPDHAHGAAGYTFWRKDFGAIHRPQHTGRSEFFYALILGGVIGFYDGFFGLGAGSFLIFLFIRFFGFDFLHASAASKVVNVATNLAAIGYFVPNGFYIPVLAAVMATANVCGSIIGTRMALHLGSGFVRKLFLVVVSALILKFAWDTF